MGEGGKEVQKGQGEKQKDITYPVRVSHAKAKPTTPSCRAHMKVVIPRSTCQVDERCARRNFAKVGRAGERRKGWRSRTEQRAAILRAQSFRTYLKGGIPWFIAKSVQGGANAGWRTRGGEVGSAKSSAKLE